MRAAQCRTVHRRFLPHLRAAGAAWGWPDMAAPESPRRVHCAVNKTLDALPTTVFTKMTNLAIKHGSINLGQGFPDNELEGPASLKEVAHR